MHGTRRISRFVTAYLRAAFQVVVLGGTGDLPRAAAVRRRG
ncbi:hypothetical protein ACIRBZ_11955 [Streptomyces sp. NPDC094038]